VYYGWLTLGRTVMRNIIISYYGYPVFIIKNSPNAKISRNATAKSVLRIPNAIAGVRTHVFNGLTSNVRRSLIRVDNFKLSIRYKINRSLSSPPHTLSLSLRLITNDKSFRAHIEVLRE